MIPPAECWPVPSKRWPSSCATTGPSTSASFMEVARSLTRSCNTPANAPKPPSSGGTANPAEPGSVWRVVTPRGSMWSTSANGPGASRHSLTAASSSGATGQSTRGTSTPPDFRIRGAAQTGIENLTREAGIVKDQHRDGWSRRLHSPDTAPRRSRPRRANTTAIRMTFPPAAEIGKRGGEVSAPRKNFEDTMYTGTT